MYALAGGKVVFKKRDAVSGSRFSLCRVEMSSFHVFIAAAGVVYTFRKRSEEAAAALSCI